MSRKQIRSNAKAALNVVFFIFMTVSLLLFLSGCEEVGLRLIIEQKVTDAGGDEDDGSGTPFITVKESSGTDVTSEWYVFDFGTFVDPDSSTETFTIHNDGDGALIVSSISVSDVDADSNYSITSTPAPVAIAPSDTEDFILQFATNGSWDEIEDGIVTIQSDDPLNSTISFDVTGYVGC